jgi:RNA polymerase sigma-70 factor (ECF subfamily)
MTGRHHTHRIPTDQLRGAQDADLLALWIDGHREGLDELARRHHSWLLRTVRLLSHREHDPEAIVQDVWLDVMRGARLYRATGRSGPGWAIVRHRITSTWAARARRPQTLVPDLPETADAPGQVEERVMREFQLHGLLAELPAEQRDAIWLVDVVGLPVAEVAHQLGVPAGTIKSRCHRGRTKLRVLITRQG